MSHWFAHRDWTWPRRRRWYREPAFEWSLIGNALLLLAVLISVTVGILNGYTG